MVNSTEIFTRRFLRVFLIFLFLFLAVALLIAWSTPATGYESSIYTSTPQILWIALICGEVAGISIVVLSLSKTQSSRNNFWKYGLLLIILGYTIILSIFIIRGYYMVDMGGDPASHLAWINEILRTGHAPSSLFYPALHFYTSEISLVTTFSPVSLHKILPFFFSFISVIFTYLFVRSLTSNKIIPVIAAGISSCPFVFSVYLTFTPSTTGNLLIPIVLFLIIKYLINDYAGWGILLYILLIVYPVYHPLPSVVIGVFLLTLWIPHAVHDIFTNFRQKNFILLKTIRRNIDKKVTIPFLVLTIWLIFWTSSYYIWGSTINDAFQSIAAEGKTSQMAVLTSQLNYAQGLGFNVFEMFLRQYGYVFLSGILSIIAFFLLWDLASSRKRLEVNIFSLYGPWAILGMTIPMLFVFQLPFSPLRFLGYINLLGPVFVASLITYLLIRSREIKRRVFSWGVSVILIILLVTLFMSVFLNVYPSPYNTEFNSQNTHREVIGMEKFFKYRNVTIPVVASTAGVQRFAALLLSPEEVKYHGYVRHTLYVDKPPWHFGYHNNTSLSFSYAKETDLIIEKRDRIIYTDYFPNLAKIRFTQTDFERVKTDPGVNLVYTNGEFDLMTIKPWG